MKPECAIRLELDVILMCDLEEGHPGAHHRIVRWGGELVRVEWAKVLYSSDP